MSQWHRNNPELYEQGYEPWDAIEAEGDRIRKDRRHELSERGTKSGLEASAAPLAEPVAEEDES